MIKQLIGNLRSLMAGWRAKPEPTMEDIDRDAERSHRRLAALAIYSPRVRVLCLDDEILEAAEDRAFAEGAGYVEEGDGETAIIETQAELARLALIRNRLAAFRARVTEEVERQLLEEYGVIARELESRYGETLESNAIRYGTVEVLLRR